MANVRIVDRGIAQAHLSALWAAVVLTAAITGPAVNVHAGGPGRAASDPTTGLVACFVSILPQAYFVERIGAEHVQVDVMVGPGQSPATYEPTAKQLARLAEANIYFSIGVPFEQALLPRIERSFENVTIVDTGMEISFSTAAGGSGHARKTDTDGHDGGDDHDHGSLDPHVWLSPRLAKTIAVNIRNALTNADPAHKTEYRDNCAELTADLDELHGKITAMMAPAKGGRFYVFHPAYGHFAAEYGVEQIAVETEGATPGPKHLAKIIEQAEADNVRVLFVQPQFSKNTADMIAKAIGADVAILDPLARDYPSNLLEIARRVSAAITAARGSANTNGTSQQDQ